MEIKLSVNGIEINVGIELIGQITSSLNDNESNQAIFHELAQHSSSSVRKEVAYKDKISEDTARILLADKDISVINNLLRSDPVKEIFNDEDFSNILNSANEEAIENVISNLDDYSSLSDAEDCLAQIIALENNYLTLQVANNYDTPKKILKKLVKHNDPDIAAAAKNSLD
ncbi:hypothetical protein JHD46_01975 [Sulfurimonas sp. SAG-AH-194-C20]|nr:hypothetical protein [Sulfurimonas sp. SAG-AH-194-C20]MDF1878403.1 hypothetical protein [Sulfurimonas sp. SAG-AH-194-C20]